MGPNPVSNTITKPEPAEISGIERTEGKVECRVCHRKIGPRTRAYRVVRLRRQSGALVLEGERFDLFSIKRVQPFWRHIDCQPKDRR